MKRTILYHRLHVNERYCRHDEERCARRDTETLSCPPAPAGVIEGSRADVSFLAGLLIDKLAYHLPFYRQHLRLTQSGIRVSRSWLTQLAQAAIALLEPIYQAQWRSILASRVNRVDETPIKAGREGPGKMRSAYFWPVMGESDEICFHYHPSRRREHVIQMLGHAAPPDGVLHTDGYSAYACGMPSVPASPMPSAGRMAGAPSSRRRISSRNAWPRRLNISGSCTGWRRKSGGRI